ncbi:hypothetical protein V1517DRAFT_375885 [Lipomyces orientalis]|uniref:Uncharacterized protein n=1 Tax=Lipomyces orientalis TaxID=1233043 RepID=A0ACC3THE0_9ASCO
MDRMNTRRNRPNYFLLNDGLDEEAKCYYSGERYPTLGISITNPAAAFWVVGRDADFEISEFENPWIVKKTNKLKLIDREIRCAVLDNETGDKCGWKTTDSKQQGSTGDMINHLRKQHSIDSPNKPEEQKEQNLVYYLS